MKTDYETANIKKRIIRLTCLAENTNNFQQISHYLKRNPELKVNKQYYWVELKSADLINI
jgi:hypothetical protein